MVQNARRTAVLRVKARQPNSKFWPHADRSSDTHYNIHGRSGPNRPLLSRFQNLSLPFGLKTFTLCTLGFGNVSVRFVRFADPDASIVRLRGIKWVDSQAKDDGARALLYFSCRLRQLMSKDLSTDIAERTLLSAPALCRVSASF